MGVGNFVIDRNFKLFAIVQHLQLCCSWIDFELCTVQPNRRLARSDWQIPTEQCNAHMLPSRINKICGVGWGIDRINVKRFTLRINCSPRQELNRWNVLCLILCHLCKVWDEC